MFTPAEEKDLWTRFKEHGDQEARDELVIAYMRVVKYVAGRVAIHVPPSIELDDLIGWGVLGLMDAAEKFDPAQNIKFATYATIRIRGAIIDEIRVLDWAPRSLRALARKIGTARDKLRNELGHDPGAEAIGDEVGVSAEEVEECMAQVQTAQVLALDDYVMREDGEETRKIDVTADGDARSPEARAEAQERQEQLVKAILDLPEQQQKVLNLYYYEELTLKEIGTVLEVSESRICQIHGAALKKLRKAMKQQD